MNLIHPYTGLTAIGTRRNGDPIWPVRGGSQPVEPVADDTDDDSATDDQQGDSADLGDAGKRALDAMKSDRNRFRSQLRSWTTLAKELGAQSPEDLRKLIAGKDQDTPDPVKIRREVEQEIMSKVARERLADKIAIAAVDFIHPSDAAVLLLSESDPDDFIDDGKIDMKAVRDALNDLKDSRPHLVKVPGKSAPKSDKSQGSRGGKPVAAREAALAEIERRFGKKPTVT